MNCPAKNDDDDLKHPTWNQSPSYLAAELTTRQDLNGIANSRVLRGADEFTRGYFGSHDAMLNGELESTPETAAGDLKGRPYCHSRDHLAGSCGHPCGTVASHSSSRSRIWDWIVWLASVLLCSFLLFGIQNLRAPANALGSLEHIGDDDTKSPTTPSSPLRMRSTCVTGGVDKGEYNEPLHVGAIFIVLSVSTAACVFPLLAKKFPRLRVPLVFFFMVRHFGTGVLIATAFVHLLPTAFISLSHPCLSKFWVEDYPAIPGAIALAGVFFVIIIEMIFHPSRHIDFTQNNAGQLDGGESVLTPLPNTTIRENSDSIQAPAPSAQAEETRAQVDVEKGSFNSASFVLTPEQQHQKDIMQCILLEIGILFHSVFIGMAISVSVGTEFLILLIAISFHQTFEGLALGSRIANIEWAKKSVKPWLMALAYGCTTPIGQAIGIGLSSLYTPDSEVGLILVGVMNAISAGLLTFASLVNLLSEDFFSNESWCRLRGMRRAWACFLVFFGAFCMSLVGAWA